MVRNRVFADGFHAWVLTGPDIALISVGNPGDVCQKIQMKRVVCLIV